MKILLIYFAVSFSIFSDQKGHTPPTVTPIQGPIFVKNGSVPVVPLFSYPTLNNGSFVQIPVSNLIISFYIYFLVGYFFFIILMIICKHYLECLNRMLLQMKHYLVARLSLYNNIFA